MLAARRMFLSHTAALRWLPSRAVVRDALTGTRVVRAATRNLAGSWQRLRNTVNIRCVTIDLVTSLLCVPKQW